MHRLLCTAGLGIALSFVAIPAAAQSVHVDVGVHTGAVGGRVIVDSHPGYPVYDRHGGYRYDDYDRRHDKRWRKAQRKYRQRLHRLQRERAKAEREYEREHRRWRREMGRHRRY